MKWPFYLIICINFVAISLLGVGFFSKSAEYTAEPRSAGECGLIRPKVRLKNLVIFVLDAFRDEFFFKFDTMHRTRSLVEEGDAIAFRAKAYHPTVTLPRIKSILSGTIPTFSDLITNFASSAFTEDNILTKSKKAQKRIVFYGDDTWLSMFPGNFFEPRSEGVSSFYVMDYTEVDNNVTRHLDRELTPNGLSNWDILVLHYLGLDHVGHSIGGEAPEIRIKLDEMDQIIFNMTQALSANRSKSGEFAILVLGDHGMTLGGGHGGSSSYETLVPVIFIQKNVNGVKKENKRVASTNHNRQMKANNRFLNVVDKLTGEMQAAALIEQVDVAPTISALLDLDRPPLSNLGVSFHSRIEMNWRYVAAKISANVQQFIDVFSSLQNIPDQLKDDIQHSLNVCQNKTAVLCRTREDKRMSSMALFILRDCEVAMRKAQGKIIEKVTANNNEYLVISIVLCFLALFVSIFLTFGLKFERFEFNLFKLIFLQPFLMFSTSFIEEEHDIWYFLLPLFILKIIWQDCCFLYGIIGREMHTKKLQSLWRAAYRVRWLLFALFLSRLGRSAFDGTRRRWLLFEYDNSFDAGRDILRVEYLHPFIVFIFSGGVLTIFATVKVFLMNMSFIYRNFSSVRYNCIPAISGFTSVFLYKLPFGLDNCTFLHRAVQCFLIWLFATKNFSLALSLWLTFIMKPSLLHLFCVCWALGFAIGKIKIISVVDKSLLLFTGICSSFYYTGNTNAISSIDIAPGYTGLAFYSPIIVGIQILLNAYAGPICVFLGWYHSMTQLPITTSKATLFVEDVIPSFMMLRCAALMASLFMNVYFQDHIFIWTVFTPKMLYEIVHFAAYSLFVLCALIFCGNEIGISKISEDNYVLNVQ